MNNLIAQNESLTMTHLQIAELVNSRVDTVKKSMLRLEEKGVIKLTPLAGVNHLGQNVISYHVTERDSYIVVAQLSPEFTAFLVDEWQKLKNKTALLPDFSNPAIAARAWADEVESKQLALVERDHAIATKAHIGSKREATAMATASKQSRRVKALEAQLQDVGSHLSLIGAGLPDRVDTELKANVQTWRLLKEISTELGKDIIKVTDDRYGKVNTYHVDVIEQFKAKFL